jgi:hypothetical protein
MVRDPTPEEIQARAAAIRRQWTPRERIRRACWTPPAWLPPILALPELNAAATAEEVPT